MRARSRVELGDVAGELLPERQRHRVLQVRAADLDDVGELLGLGVERVAQRVHRRDESLATISSAAAMCIAVGKVSFDDCDMFTSSFGWTGFFAAHLAAGQLDRAVRDDLVDVHVGLRARAGLPDAQREVVVELAGDHLVGRLHDQLASSRRSSLPEVAVDQRGGLLEDAERADDLRHRGMRSSPMAKWMQRALRSARPSSGRRGRRSAPCVSLSTRCAPTEPFVVVVAIAKEGFGAPGRGHSARKVAVRARPASRSWAYTRGTARPQGRSVNHACGPDHRRRRRVPHVRGRFGVRRDEGPDTAGLAGGDRPQRSRRRPGQGRRGRHPGRDRRFGPYVADHRSDVPAARLLGDLYFRVPDYARAEKVWKGIIAAQPGDKETHNRLGSLYAVQDRIDDAIAEFQKSLPSRAGYEGLVLAAQEGRRPAAVHGQGAVRGRRAPLRSGGLGGSGPFPARHAPVRPRA